MVSQERNKDDNNNDDDKYTEEYFERRIQTLRHEIVEALPSKDLVVDPDGIFAAILQSYEYSQQTLQASTTVLEGLQQKLGQNEKINDDNDDDDNDDEIKTATTPVDPSSLIDAAKKAVQAAQQAKDNLSETAVKIGSSATTNSGLLHILRTSREVQHKILECTVLVQSTPKKLADWCAEDPKQHHAFLDVFLANPGCMKGFLVAGGPVHGNFGPALVICGHLHLQVQEKEGRFSKRRKLLERLAIAVALEHASPIPIWKQESTDNVDPIERFWHYADAHLDGSLDAAFETLSVWEMRLVVDSNATHDDLTWAREYLKAYRPDEVWMKDERWRYAMAVKSDVGYRHPDHEFNNYKDLVSAGGKCGARAWFGRFVCKAWGIPTWGIRQPGHAAMSRWTSDGWKICLGAPHWDVSWWDEMRYNGEKGVPTRQGSDFLEEAMARRNARTCCGRPYEDVILLECVAECLGETVEGDFASTKFWRSLALAERKFMANALPSNPSSSSIIANEIISQMSITSVSSVDEVVRVDENGQVIIPAASYTKNSNNISSTASFLGGKQVHFLKQHDAMAEYELPSTIQQGSYNLSLKLVNIHRDQAPMEFAVDHSSCMSSLHPNGGNDDDFEMVPMSDPQVMKIPYTMGRWETTTDSFRVDLSPGAKLQLLRKSPCWGLTVKEIVLVPL